MDNIRFVIAVLKFEYDLLNSDKENYEKEFISMSEYEEDTIGQWLKIAKAKGDTENSDPILLELIVELHKKIDRLTSIVKGEERKLINLPNKDEINQIGFEHIKSDRELFEIGKEYYLRISMPVFPKREIPIIAKAISKDILEFIKIHQKDEKDWASYIMARERVMIREKRAKKDV